MIPEKGFAGDLKILDAVMTRDLNCIDMQLFHFKGILLREEVLPAIILR